MTAESIDDSTLKLKRTIRAPRERVFAAFASAEALVQWFGPETCSVLEAELDFTPGGSYRIVVQTETFGELVLSGKYEEIVEPERLGYTWNWKGAEALEFGETRVAFEFIDRGEATELVLTHSGFPVEEARDNHDEGWTGTFDKLERYLA